MRFLEDDQLTDEAGIDITPLVDVVFLLLIFFMVSANFVSSGGIDVKLPSAAAKPSTSEAEDLVVSIDQAGRMFVDGAALSLPELEQQLARRGKSAGALVVRADKRALHGRVVQVMDLAKRAGVAKLAIATEPE